MARGKPFLFFFFWGGGGGGVGRGGGVVLVNVFTLIVFCRNSCKLTVQTLIRRHILRRNLAACP